jgi:hypothetical protein
MIAELAAIECFGGNRDGDSNGTEDPNSLHASGNVTRQFQIAEMVRSRNRFFCVVCGLGEGSGFWCVHAGMFVRLMHLKSLGGGWGGGRGGAGSSVVPLPLEHPFCPACFSLLVCVPPPPA